MGTYAGHVIPGSFFIVTGLWWWINVLRIYSQMSKAQRNVPVSFKSTTWFPIPIKYLRSHPIEPAIRMVAGIVGIVIELTHTSHLINEKGQFINLNNYAHAAMYLIFIIWSMVEMFIFYNVIQLPNCSEHVFAAIALAIEGVLFLFHLGGRPKLDQQLHTFLYVTIFLSAIVLFLEGWMESSLLLLVLRVFLVLLQGTWFIQIAHCLYGTQPWEDIKPNQEFVAIGFSWHIIGLLIFVVVGFVVMSIKSRGCKCRKNASRPGFKESDFEMQNKEDDERRALIEGGVPSTIENFA